MNEQQFGLSTIGQIMIPVRDVPRATAFYRDVLRIPFLFAFPRMAFFDADGVRLYLAEVEEAVFEGGVTLYFRVRDLPSAVAALEARGLLFHERPHLVHRDTDTELWMAFANDPDENNIGLMSEVPVPVPG